MRFILVAVGAILLSGCATRIYEDNHLIASIEGDATNVTIRTSKTYFHADTLNHSQPIEAGGKVTTGILGQLSGIATVLRAIFPFLP